MTIFADWRPWAQLVRLPNVFTVWADVGLGVAVASGVGGVVNSWAVLLLAGSSTCLYWAGMVLNDVFDFGEDRRDRPQRPLPSGRIAFRLAAALGVSLLLGGVGLAVFAGWFADSNAGVVAALVAAAILAYDGGLKRAGLGPALMGACRLLNVTLASQAAAVPVTASLFPAVLVGTYIGGVTWFAREEAQHSRRSTLVAGLLLTALAWLALALSPWLQPRPWSPTEQAAFSLGGLALLLAVFGPLHDAWQDPTPARVQTAVKRLLICLIVLDALLALAWVGWKGLLILLLLPPTLWLGRYVYST